MHSTCSGHWLGPSEQALQANSSRFLNFIQRDGTTLASRSSQNMLGILCWSTRPCLGVGVSCSHPQFLNHSRGPKDGGLVGVAAHQNRHADPFALCKDLRSPPGQRPSRRQWHESAIRDRFSIFSRFDLPERRRSSCNKSGPLETPRSFASCSPERSPVVSMKVVLDFSADVFAQCTRNISRFPGSRGGTALGKVEMPLADRYEAFQPIAR